MTLTLSSTAVPRRSIQDQDAADCRPAFGGASVDWHLLHPVLAVSKAQILLRILEEYLYRLSIRVRPDQMLRRRTDLVRSEIPHRILFVLVVCSFLRNEESYLAQFRDRDFCVRIL